MNAVIGLFENGKARITRFAPFSLRLDKRSRAVLPARGDIELL
jgi:hypothetical protein